MVSQNMLRTHEGKKVFSKKNRFMTAPDISNASHRSNNRDYFLRAHLFRVTIYLSTMFPGQNGRHIENIQGIPL